MDSTITGMLNVKYADGEIVAVFANLSGFLFKEDGNDAWISYCRELDLSTCGETEEDSMKNMREAIDLFFQTCVDMGTLASALHQLGWVLGGRDNTLEEVVERRLPQELLPAYIIDRLERTGNDWSTSVNFGS